MQDIIKQKLLADFRIIFFIFEYREVKNQTHLNIKPHEVIHGLKQNKLSWNNLVYMILFQILTSCFQFETKNNK